MPEKANTKLRFHLLFILILPPARTLPYSMHPRMHDRIVPQAVNVFSKNALQRSIQVHVNKRVVMPLEK